jgi:hypothetical protein
MKYPIIVICLFILFSCTKYSSTTNDETFAPLKDGNVPQTVEELWEGYNPRKEPLDVEILKEWEEDSVVMKVLRYRIGIFKGQKAMMAAIYGYPKGAKNLPGLVQIHGGGQYADYRAVLTNAKRGYTTISIAWAGRINAPEYLVDNEHVKLFWNDERSNPDYKITTDWGALDAYHAPSRFMDNPFGNISPYPWTIDSVDSPRNNGWFLCALGARRALTFLEHQPQVDSLKLGVYGHSMGGKLTVMAAMDKRVKAAAPSCGGISDRYSENELYSTTIGDDVYLRSIECPIFFLSPANDFHGRINDLQKALNEIKSTTWRITCSPHHNHQDTPEYEVATQLWFDQILKNTFKVPETPEIKINLETKTGIPKITVIPDASKEILDVDVYYTQQGRENYEITNREHRMNRFWHYAKTQKSGDSFTVEIPLLTTDKSVWVYANVLYPLDESITGAGYYYRIYTANRFNISSRMLIATPDQLKKAGVVATDKPSLVIETFKNDWQKEWFTYDLTDNWARKTHKLYDPKWRAPDSAKLMMEVLSEQPNKLVVGIDNYAAEVQMKGNNQWQQVILAPADFHNASGDKLSGWNDVKELRMSPMETIKEKVDGENKTQQLGAAWQGKKPKFRMLQWKTDNVKPN